MFRLGRDCLCHREAPTLGRLTFPLCWRCTGIVAGMAALQPLASLGCLNGFSVAVALALGIGCALPAAVDVFCQLAGPYRSNRRCRLATGMLLGGGIVFIARVLGSLLRGLS